VTLPPIAQGTIIYGLESSGLGLISLAYPTEANEALLSPRFNLKVDSLLLYNSSTVKSCKFDSEQTRLYVWLIAVVHEVRVVYTPIDIKIKNVKPITAILFLASDLKTPLIKFHIIYNCFVNLYHNKKKLQNRFFLI
jgi:hypothetical protein